MNRNILVMASGILLASAMVCAPVSAAVNDQKLAKAYDEVINLQDNMDSIDLTIKEVTIVPDIKDNQIKTTTVKANGLQNPSNLEVSIVTETSEGTKEQYYKDGCYYTDDTGEDLKHKMEPDEMIDLMNYYIYMDLNSSILETLEYEDNTYSFTATSDSLGIFTDKILEGVQSEHLVSLLALQGYTRIDDQDHIVKRRVQTVYTINSGDEPKTCSVNTTTDFHNPGKTADIDFPDLSGYKDANAKQSAVTIKEEIKTIYATDDLNVRAQNTLTAAILGGIAAGDSVQQKGITSDGWIQIDFNGTTAYISADYVSDKKPVIVKDMSGMMYATTEVFVRSKASTDGEILGSLAENEAISVSGYTNNNWIRVNYNGTTAYVSKDFLTWDRPVTAMGGTMFVVSESANVRSSYDTDSSIIGSLSFGDTVEVTGYTASNWIRVKYSGKTGYIYGVLLSWSDPNSQTSSSSSSSSGAAVTSTVSQAYGVVINCGMDTITVTLNNGKTIVCDKTKATILAPSGMRNGLYVSIVYEKRSDGTCILQSLDEV